MRELKPFPIIGGRHNQGEIPEKLAWELWLDRGTIRKAALALYREYGYYSDKKTKCFPNGEERPYTDRSVEVAAKRYVLFNQEDARKLYEDKYGQVSDNIWYDCLVRYYNSVLIKYSLTTLRKWQANHPEVMEYAQQTTSRHIKKV